MSINVGIRQMPRASLGEQIRSGIEEAFVAMGQKLGKTNIVMGLGPRVVFRFDPPQTPRSAPAMPIWRHNDPARA